ncbi:hypothetical protein [Ruminococcus flavefaciens]|uniref:hypothetical protein n=1 Tax=Ruminococcus flavefaciens TaxID=1265 RepID=UPI0026EA58CC|nr:hypothetical protein [Ruminococcus flavefaciens]
MENETNTQPEVKGEKLFTQEEVNKIVAERLKRERSKAEEAAVGDRDTRAAELDARESRLACREYLLDSGLPASMLDCLDTSDLENFKKKAEALSNDFAAKAPCNATPSFNVETPVSDTLAAAFSREAKHVPQVKYSGTENYHYFDGREQPPSI